MNELFNNQQEREVIINELLQDVKEQKSALKNQEERVHRLDESITELYQKQESWEVRLLSRIEELLEGRKTDTTSLEAVLKQGLLEVKEEVKKQHINVYEHKHYNVFGDRLGVDSFVKLADTGMKWIVILILAFSVVYVIRSWSDHQFGWGADQQTSAQTRRSVTE